MNEWTRHGCFWNSEKGTTSVQSTCSFTEEIGRELAQDLERQRKKERCSREGQGRGRGHCDSRDIALGINISQTKRGT